MTVDRISPVVIAAFFLWANAGVLPATSLSSYNVLETKPIAVISTEKTEYDPGDEIYISLKIDNTAETPLYILVPNPYGHLCRIIITDKKADKTIIMKYPKGPWKDVSYRAFRIASDSSFYQKMNVGKFQAGRYTLQVEYDSSPALATQGVWAGSILSNKIEIVVLPKQEQKTDRASLGAKSGLSSGDNGLRKTFMETVSSRFRHIAIDRNGDGKPDMWQDLEREIIIRDTDYNGIPDTWDYFKKGRLFRSGYDTDGDGMPDVFTAQ